MPSENFVRIVITGDHDDSLLPTKLPSGVPIDWILVPVLKFERLPLPREMVKSAVFRPFDWWLFTSIRAVTFWAQSLRQFGFEKKPQSQVACVGSHTAQAAETEGFMPDFFPSSPGSEKFLAEFEENFCQASAMPSVLILMAEGGRTTLRESLSGKGCQTTAISVYRSVARDDWEECISREQLENAALLLFTSPSSVEAWTKCRAIPRGLRVGSIGGFTSSHLLKRGIEHRVLPESDFSRIGEIL